MKEKLEVFNPTDGNISFSVYPSVAGFNNEGLAQHHARRRMRGAFKQVLVPRSQSVDIVDVSGLSIADIKASTEFHKFVKQGKLRILAETHIIEVDDDFEPEEPKAEAPLVTRPLDKLNNLMDAIEEVKANPPPIERFVDVVVEPCILKVEDEPKPEKKVKAKKKPKKKRGRPPGSRNKTS